LAGRQRTLLNIMASELVQPSLPHGGAWWRLSPGDLLRDAAFRRIWLSTLLGGLGGQVTMLALPLAAAVLLGATPMQMGWLTALESLPFMLFSLPAGVWLDRVRKLPVYVAGEWTVAAAVASVPVAWALGVLGMPLLYGVAFVLGCVTTIAGSASQIVLVQAVPRERLVEAHAKSALASAGAEVAGPGLAGVLVRLAGAPLALLVDAAMMIASAAIVRRIRVVEQPVPATRGRFLADLVDGVRFVRRHRLLWPLALTVATWHLCYHAALVVQILLATRGLGLSEQAIGFAYVGMGLGSTLGSAVGGRLSARLGPGPTLVAGIVLTACGWCAPVLAGEALAVPAFVAMLVLIGFGAVLVFVNFLALRQAVTPPALLGRMTATMRWLVLAPAVPGALLGGWMGEHYGLRAPLAFAGVVGAALALVAWRQAEIRGLRTLPALAPDEAGAG
jgi:MFS family permease